MHVYNDDLISVSIQHVCDEITVYKQNLISEPRITVF